MGSIDIQGVQMEIPDGIRVIQIGIPDGTTRILIEMGEITIIIETQTMDKILVTRIKTQRKNSPNQGNQKRVEFKGRSSTKPVGRPLSRVSNKNLEPVALGATYIWN